MDFGAGYTHYIVYGQDLTEGVYNYVANKQAEKPDAVWYEFTNENIEEVFSGTPPQSAAPENTPVSSQISQQAAEALEADFREYWDTVVKDGMVLPVVSVFQTNRFAGMENTVFVVYPTWRKSCTVIYSVNGNTVKRLGEVLTGFDFALSSSNGGMFRTSWTYENTLMKSGENDDDYYTVSPEGVELVLSLGASVFEGAIEKGFIYQESGTVELTAEEYQLQKEKADRDFSDAQIISFVPADFGAPDTGFDISSEESFAEYILDGGEKKKTSFNEESEEIDPVQDSQNEFGPSGNPAAVMDEEQQRYYNTYFRGWYKSPFHEDFTENDDPTEDQNLYFVFNALFSLDHPDDSNELLEQMYDDSYNLVVPAEVFENTVTSHFNTTVQALRRNLRYKNGDFYDEETNTYHFGTGYGGVSGETLSVSGAQQKGDLLEIEYNWFEIAAFHPSGRLLESGVLTIRLLPDGGWKYIANRITYNLARDG